MRRQDRVWNVHVRLVLPHQGGEGMLQALVDRAGYDLCKDDNSTGDKFKATLNNASLFYSELYAGAEIELITDGINAPIIMIDPSWRML